MQACIHLLSSRLSRAQFRCFPAQLSSRLSVLFTLITPKPASINPKPLNPKHSGALAENLQQIAGSFTTEERGDCGQLPTKYLKKFKPRCKPFGV